MSADRRYNPLRWLPKPRLEPAGLLTISDAARFHYFHVVRRGWPIAGIVLLMFAMSVFGLLVVVVSGDMERMKNLGLMWLVFLVWTLLACASPYWSARRQFAKQDHLRQPMRFYFREDRVRQEGPNFSGELSWQIIAGVYETNSLFLIYHQSHQMAWILPKRFFWGDELMIQRWRKFVTGHLSSPRLFHERGILGELI